MTSAITAINAANLPRTPPEALRDAAVSPSPASTHPTGRPDATPRVAEETATRPGQAADRKVAADSPTKKPDRQALAKVVNEVQQKVQTLLHTQVEFNIDDQYNEMVVRVTDAESKELIRQIPSEEMLALAQFFKDMDSEQTKMLDLKLPNGPTNPRAALEGLLLRVRV
ncbi:flagellar protein FlaG [Candidatus Contendibacter odensensis]|uniref:FlaG domain protein n=1 Tax=Candidatus Contendobacter odensis Run_B_J11 TaxID=1400861 RepID=A0A7U7J2H6_9GAMM|nr:flagellar protein FlaG [Candidatus Contendobacter odensis]CDH44157.1 putative FlaG domain protein [Candidatus Contendobacter odensis Run_B_J11]